MFNYLAAIYKDPNREENAKIEYNTLKMRLREDFYSFYTKFSYLTSESKIATSQLKSDLRYKLNAELYRAIIPSYGLYTNYVALARLL
jgi:hypothetical protein